jgi:NAD(P)-dependent dehydrogenase (short-subunit alcohol dehydrogenase family)
MNPRYGFAGKVALVTGAASGMGLAVARAAPNRSAAIVLPETVRELSRIRALRATSRSTTPVQTPDGAGARSPAPFYVARASYVARHEARGAKPRRAPEGLILFP